MFSEYRICCRNGKAAYRRPLAGQRTPFFNSQLQPGICKNSVAICEIRVPSGFPVQDRGGYDLTRGQVASECHLYKWHLPQYAPSRVRRFAGRFVGKFIGRFVGPTRLNNGSTRCTSNCRVSFLARCPTKCPVASRTISPFSKIEIHGYLRENPSNMSLDSVLEYLQNNFIFYTYNHVLHVLYRVVLRNLAS